MIHIRTINTICQVATICALLATEGAAQEGNNTRAITQGMMPLIIRESGSYVVTENLSVTNERTHGIRVEADHVSIEMQSFLLSGPGKESGSGIYQAAEYSHLKLSHCKIANWEGSLQGDDIVHGCGVEALGVSNHFNWVQTYTNYQGLRVGDRAYLRRCIAKYGVIGMMSGEQCHLDFCTMTGNSEFGLRAGENSVLEKCTVYSNKLGLITQSGSTSLHCTAYGNATVGLQGRDRTTFKFCSTYENDVGLHMGDTSYAIQTAAVDNRSIGIDAGHTATIDSCAAVKNADTGIRVLSDARVADSRAIENGRIGIHVLGDRATINANQLTQNKRGLVVEGMDGTITRNVAKGNAIAGYEIAPSNYLGQILSARDEKERPKDANTED